MSEETETSNGHRISLPSAEPGTDFTLDWLDNFRGFWSPNTERALRADMKVFRDWCGLHRLQAWPTSAETLARFIESAAVEKSPATVRRYVSSIASLHRLAGLENPVDGMEAQLALKRIQIHNGRRQQQALGLTSKLLQRLLKATGSRLIDVRDRALLTVAYDALLRRSELVALQVPDLHVDVDGSGTLLVRRSKTDPKGDGALQYLAPDTMGKVREWLDRTGLRGGWLFRSVRLNGTLGDSLDASQIPRIFRKMARNARLSERIVRGLSGHSARVGATQDMIAEGIELPMVMQAGRWKSPAMVSRYGARLLARRGGTARLARLRRLNRQARR